MALDHFALNAMGPNFEMIDQNQVSPRKIAYKRVTTQKIRLLVWPFSKRLRSIVSCFRLRLRFQIRWQVPWDRHFDGGFPIRQTGHQTADVAVQIDIGAASYCGRVSDPGRSVQTPPGVVGQTPPPVKQDRDGLI
jgi:hypothetical protein